MAQITVNACDVHHKKFSKIEEGEDYVVSLQMPGEEDSVTYAITLGKPETGCKDRELIGKVKALLEECGTRITGGPWKVVDQPDKAEILPDPESPAIDPPPPAPAPPAPTPVLVAGSIRTKQLFDLIERTRIAQGISAGDLSEKADVSRPTITKWRHGNGVPKHAHVLRITEVLDLDRKKVRELTGLDVPEADPVPPVKEEPPAVVWNDGGLEGFISQEAEKEVTPSGSPLAVKAPEWVQGVTAKCKEETEERDPLNFPILCGAVVDRAHMTTHARRAHGYDHAAQCVWELVGMPEGTEAHICDCGLPFPTLNSMVRHQHGHCHADGKTVVVGAGGRAPKAVKPTRKVHMVGHVYGNNPATGEVSHNFN